MMLLGGNYPGSYFLEFGEVVSIPMALDVYDEGNYRYLVYDEGGSRYGVEEV